MDVQRPRRNRLGQDRTGDDHEPAARVDAAYQPGARAGVSVGRGGCLVVARAQAKDGDIGLDSAQHRLGQALELLGGGIIPHAPDHSDIGLGKSVPQVLDEPRVRGLVAGIGGIGKRADRAAQDEHRNVASGAQLKERARMVPGGITFGDGGDHKDRQHYRRAYGRGGGPGIMDEITFHRCG